MHLTNKRFLKPALSDQLNLLDVTPRQIDLVINTCLHIDHMGNNHLFNNPRIVLSKIEREFADN
ncbi:MBL fold metallo-hydrolase [candidate division KSB1 bacterium]|nr:MBL fold metallo-hydrolase [candidate division KSB1 bacterium]